MAELLANDLILFGCAGLGLAATALVIVRDALRPTARPIEPPSEPETRLERAA